ncbi:MAG: hypothetical protein JJT88_13400 [Gammaproteobacteria bacterium]|nr:hypothetical protein [Gammaproteobacteria bacterium]
MVTRVLLGFVLLQALIWGHYFWSASLLSPALGEIDFASADAVTGRIGPLPFDRYLVTFTFPHGYGTNRPDRTLIGRELREEGRVGIDIRVTGFLGRPVLSYSLAQISSDWRFTTGGRDPNALLWNGAAEFRALPMERYTVTARLSGENPFLEDRRIVLGLKGNRDDGYHGLGHIILSYSTAALFVFILGVWIIIKVIGYLSTRS